jgi:hypothetical protein
MYIYTHIPGNTIRKFPEYLCLSYSSKNVIFSFFLLQNQNRRVEQVLLRGVAGVNTHERGR